MEPDALFDTLKEYSASFGNTTRGSMLAKIKQIAFDQIPKSATKDVLSSILTPEHYVRMTELIGASIQETAAKFKSTLKVVSDCTNVAASMSDHQIISLINEQITLKSDEWESKWVNCCDGKSVISEIFREFRVRLSILDFKKKIWEISKTNNYENWRLIESKLKELSSGIR